MPNHSPPRHPTSRAAFLATLLQGCSGATLTLRPRARSHARRLEDAMQARGTFSPKAHRAPEIAALLPCSFRRPGCWIRWIPDGGQHPHAEPQLDTRRSLLLAALYRCTISGDIACFLLPCPFPKNRVPLIGCLIHVGFYSTARLRVASHIAAQVPCCPRYFGRGLSHPPSPLTTFRV